MIGGARPTAAWREALRFPALRQFVQLPWTAT